MRHFSCSCDLIQLSIPSLGIGYSIIVIQIFARIYLVILAYSLFYLIYSFTAKLPWATCSNYWNTGWSLSLKDQHWKRQTFRKFCHVRGLKLTPGDVFYCKAKCVLWFNLQQMLVWHSLLQTWPRNTMLRWVATGHLKLRSLLQWLGVLGVSH